MRQTCLLLTVCIVCIGALALGQDDELPHGLLAEFRSTAADTQRTRIDADVSEIFGASIDPLLPSEPGGAIWTGQLLIREQSEYTFHVYVQGTAEVFIDDQRVLTAAQKLPAWTSGAPVPLDFGFHSLEVTYSNTEAYTKTQGTGELHLYWSSSRFPLEPVPAHLLFLPDDLDSGLTSRIAAEERGRTLFDAHRCNRCHRRNDEPLSLPAPDLSHIAAGTNPEWLVEKIAHERADATAVKMPDFGLTEPEARAVAAYLLHASRPLELEPVPKLDPNPKNPPPDGSLLLNSLGCLACHRVGELGSSRPFGGGDLSTVGARLTRERLFAQLTDPARINAHARMPVFPLSDIERLQLVDALASQTGGSRQYTGAPAEWQNDSNLVEQGKQMIAAARCAACHEIPGIAAPEPVALRPEFEAVQSCLADKPDRERRRPVFPEEHRDDLRAWVAVRPRSQPDPRAADPFTTGRFVLDRNNCLACHERGLDPGIVPVAGSVAASDVRLTGQSQALIPPNLTAVGDKLLDPALAAAVSGEQPRRMPWLLVRMPKFRHTPEDKAALLSYLIGHDRIPDGAPALPLIPDLAEVDPQTLVTGRALAGATGFSCIACHECGPYVPPNVAIATHGSNLLQMAERMRPEYFLRWTRSPLRIVPGMEMPSYDRPVPGILDGKADTQLAALWHALNDPRFTVPTNPTAVEQLLNVQPGDAPRIVRDVFTVAEDNGGGYVPRALAMGFDNGHSILFDLDRGCVRGWTIGEFARQRTQGKSWFWDLAGTPLATGISSASDLVLKFGSETADPLGPDKSLPGWRLESYDVAGDAVELVYDVAFDANSGPVTVRVSETWQSASGGVQRRIQADVPGKARLCFRTTPLHLGHPGSLTITGRQTIRVPSEAAGDDARTQTVVEFGDESANRVQQLSVLYSSPLERVQGPPIEPGAITPNDAPVATAPGFDGVRLPLSQSIMPTGLAWTRDGSLVFTSLKGHVYIARDADGDGVEESITQFEEGLAAPFGVLPDGDDLLVAHKPELLRLQDIDHDGRADRRIVVAAGWGYTHDYHDWTAGPVRAADGSLFLAISSDYSNNGRDPLQLKWRGKVLRIDSTGAIEPYAHELRFPMGIAFDASGHLFVSDQQGVQNTFNEIDHIIEGGRYGVPAQADPKSDEGKLRATVQVPHPWTRSVNGIFFLPPLSTDQNADDRNPLHAFAGHGIGCEYNGRFLIRFTTQEVDGQLQGAVYEFTSTTWDDDAHTFLGPICGGVSPDGDIYIGSIFDSGWLGGRNTGEIVRLHPSGSLPNGIKEVRAVPGGFQIEFIRPLDPAQAADVGHYAISGYTRVWEGAYATPDSGRYEPPIRDARVEQGGRQVDLRVDDLREGFVYELTCEFNDDSAEPLHPRQATYTMNLVPGH